MNSNEREAPKSKIDADLVHLISESWHTEVIAKLEKVLFKLREIILEGYDD